MNFIDLQKDISIYNPSEKTLFLFLFLSDHQMTHPRQWTCQEQSTDMVANFDSMCKIFPGDAQAQ